MPLPIALLPFGDEAAIGKPTQDLPTSLLFYDPSLYAVLVANGKLLHLSPSSTASDTLH